MEFVARDLKFKKGEHKVRPYPVLCISAAAGLTSICLTKLGVSGSFRQDYPYRFTQPAAICRSSSRLIILVLQWAAQDGGTLVVVTADHETGGWTLLGGDIASGKVKGKFSTDGHSGVMVPVYSFGPKAETFTGIFENTDLFNKMREAYDLGD